MRRNSNRLHQSGRQRQKLSRRMVMVLLGSCLTCLIVALTFFFHLSHVDKSTAATRELIIDEQEFTQEKMLVVPFINTNVNSTGDVQLVRKAREIQTAIKAQK